MTERLLPEVLVNDEAPATLEAALERIDAMKATLATHRHPDDVRRIEELLAAAEARDDDETEPEAFTEVLKKRLKDPVTIILLIVALLVFVGSCFVGFNFSSLQFVIGGLLVAIGFAIGGPLLDGQDFKGRGKLVEAGFLMLMVGGMLVCYSAVSQIKAALDAKVGEQTVQIDEQGKTITQKGKTIDRWNLLGSRTAPGAKDGELEFADDLYNQIGRDASSMTVPRFVDAGRWLIKMPDGSKVVLHSGLKGDVTVEFDADKMVVKGVLPDTARLYYVGLTNDFMVVTSKSRQIPAVGTAAK